MSSEEQPREAFQVDLHGVVDLFARHLYSSPRVFMREMLQNGVDAITARHAIDPTCPAQVRLIPRTGKTPSDTQLEVVDTGIGLSRDEATDLLATIGRSSKREEDVEKARGQYLGQFGIGLLSAFMVAEEIEMFSRSARNPDEPPIVWRGFANGSYTLTTITLDEYVAARGDDFPGSLVRLIARHDQWKLLTRTSVTALAKEYGSLLPVDVSIEVPMADGEVLWDRITQADSPWLATHPSQQDRAAALTRHCRETLGFTPLAAFDINLPVAGVTGIGFVLPNSTAPSARSAHRVYLKRMLVGTHVAEIVPDWAFFVRCIIDSSSLRPTASREALYEDEVLIATREALGKLIMEWTAELLNEDSDIRREFVRVHHLAIRSLALHDDQMLDLAARVLPYETTLGMFTLEEFAREQGGIRYTPSLEEFHRIGPVASAQELGVVNAGYVYDAELLGKLAARHPEWNIRLLQAGDVEATLTPLEPHEELPFFDYMMVARHTLEPLSCEPVLRYFDPVEIPSLFVTNAASEHQRSLEDTQTEVDNLWSQVLGGFAHSSSKRHLVLNAGNEAVKALASISDQDVAKAATNSLYVTSRLSAGEPLRHKEAVLLNESLTALLRSATQGADNSNPGSDGNAGPADGNGDTHGSHGDNGGSRD
ncbi:MAG: HSP90 family protein [Propionibacteriaceae bacterium]|jgi:molecular chaperone HtpG|nr:HSP90 family protein [Propionibacteriaceae bacterium]